MTSAQGLIIPAQKILNTDTYILLNSQVVLFSYKLQASITGGQNLSKPIR